MKKGNAAHRCIPGALFLAGGMLLGGLLPGCGTSRRGEVESLSQRPSTEEAVPNQLVGLAESREEAEQIAEDYGIELLEFRDGVALFSTQEDPDEVIRRGRQNGLVPLDKNQIYHAMEEKTQSK